MAAPGTQVGERLAAQLSRIRITKDSCQRPVGVENMVLIGDGQAFGVFRKRHFQHVSVEVSPSVRQRSHRVSHRSKLSGRWSGRPSGRGGTGTESGTFGHREHSSPYLERLSWPILGRLKYARH